MLWLLVPEVSNEIYDNNIIILMLFLYYIDNKLSRGLIIYSLIFFLDAFPRWFRLVILQRLLRERL